MNAITKTITTAILMINEMSFLNKKDNATTLKIPRNAPIQFGFPKVPRIAL